MKSCTNDLRPGDIVVAKAHISIQPKHSNAPKRWEYLMLSTDRMAILPPHQPAGFQFSITDEWLNTYVYQIRRKASE